MATTGIAVFAYNRPDHLSRVLDGLKRNDVDHLYIFSDGARTESDIDRVQTVRTLISDIDWCVTTVVTRDQNLGLAESVVTGVERVLEDHDRIIVLEDDCVPASNYISFMKTCLERYKADERVMNVSGYCPPIQIPPEYPYDVFFTYRNSSWGWATWESAWKQFEQNPVTLDELERNDPQLDWLRRHAGYDLVPMMKDQLRGEIDSWAVWWAYAIATQRGLCLNPVDSKITNIGHQGEGTHVGETERYDVRLDETEVDELSFPDDAFVDEDVNTRYVRFQDGGRWYPMKRRGARILRRFGLWSVYRTLTRS